MSKISIAALSALMVGLATPAFAASDCDEGFKSHLGKMSIYVNRMSGYELADAVRKSLDAYNTCKSGDSFSVHGVWDQIIADMQKKAGR